MRKAALVICIFIAACGKKSQDGVSYADVLKYNADNTTNAVKKIQSISRLAWYYMEISEKSSDSAMQAAYAYAENRKGDNHELIVLCYLYDAERHLILYDYKDHLNAVSDLSEKAANLSIAYGLPDYEAYSYLYKARANRFLGNSALAKEYIDKADALEKNTKSDSLKIEFFTTSSQVYQSVRKLNDALLNASYALTEAEKSENPNLKIAAYMRLGHVYDDIDTLKAKENYKSLLEQCEAQNNKEELIGANIYLGSYFSSQPEYASEASRYLHAAQELAKQINHIPLLMQTHKELVDYFIKTNQPDSAKAYLEKNLNAITTYYTENGLAGRIYYSYGEFYFRLGENYKRQMNSYPADQSFRWALTYFRKAEDAYATNVIDSKKCMLQYYYGASSYYLYFLNKYKFNKNPDWSLSAGDAETNQHISDYFNYSLDFFFEAQRLAHSTNDPQSMRNITSWMESLFGDSTNYYDSVHRGYIYSERIPKFNYYKMSYLTRIIYDSCDKTVESYKSEKKNFAIEAIAKASMEEVGKEKQQHKDNIKIVGIVFALVVVFLALVFGGYLRVPLSVTRGLNFFAFIFLFEFILLLTERWVHEFTHGELVSSLLIKVVLAAFLVPLHHILEETVIHKIENRNKARDL